MINLYSGLRVITLENRRVCTYKVQLCDGVLRWRYIGAYYGDTTVGGARVFAYARRMHYVVAGSITRGALVSGTPRGLIAPPITPWQVRGTKGR